MREKQMTKIEAGHYKTDDGIEIFRCEETIYYSRCLLRPNRWGNMSTACSRKVSDWAFKINGEVVRGFGSRSQALKSARRLAARSA